MRYLIGASMNKREALQLFVEDVAGGTSQPPDQYQDWYTPGYAGHRADLMAHWRAGRESIKRDLNKVPQIDALLEQALASFDKGEREPGRTLMCDIDNLLTHPTQIR